MSIFSFHPEFKIHRLKFSLCGSWRNYPVPNSKNDWISTFLLSLWKLTNKTRWRKFPVIFYQNNRNKISFKFVSNLIRNAFNFIMKFRGMKFLHQGMKFLHRGMKFLYQEMKLFWKYRLSNGFISVISR